MVKISKKMILIHLVKLDLDSGYFTQLSYSFSTNLIINVKGSEKLLPEEYYNET